MTRAHRIPIDQLRQRAAEELAANPTIVSYIIDGDTISILNWHNEIQRRINYALAALADIIGVPHIDIACLTSADER